MKEFENSKILIVGGAGFVGSNLTKMILQHTSAVRVVVVDNFLSSEKNNLPEDQRLEVIEGSIASDTVLAKIDDTFHYIFHLATYHGNQSSIHDPLADHENNTLTTLKLFNHCKNFIQIKKIVYSSAGCSVAKKNVEDATATFEDDPISLDQDSPYSISKVIGEFYSAYFFKQHTLPVVRARFQNVFGPGEVLGAGKWRGTPATVWRNVTPTFIYRALHKVPLLVDNGGKGSRDFIFVDDICRGLIACAVRGKAGDVYNLASGVETTILELATFINEMTHNSAGITFMPKRAWDHSIKRFGSNSKAKKELGFEVATPFREGLMTTIRWTQKEMSRIQQCVDKHSHYMNKAV